jgi:hypothetical protein
MRKRILAVLLAVLTVMTFSGCKIDSYFASKQFDLTDEKIIWEGSVDDEFEETCVYVVLKKTDKYPKLRLSAFNLKNAESLEYINLKPTENSSADFRQSLWINLKKHGDSAVVEAIRQLEKLDFVKQASPMYIVND